MILLLTESQILYRQFDTVVILDLDEMVRQNGKAKWLVEQVMVEQVMVEQVMFRNLEMGKATHVT